MQIMKIKEYMRHGLFFISLSILAIFAACSDDKDENYLDDGAYPPPAVSITSSASLPEVMLASEETVTGKVAATNGLRDVYATPLRKVGDTYEEIDKNRRVPFKLAEFPKNLDFSINIPIAYEDMAGIKVVATDIFTKVNEQIISIGHINGIPPKVTTDPAEFASVDFNADITVRASITSTEGLKSIVYNLIQKSPYKELHTPISIPVSGEKQKDIQFTLNVDNENAEAVSIIITDAKDVVRTVLVDIKRIAGVPDGKAAIFEDVEMFAEWEAYIDAVPAVSPSLPYLFSAEGVLVNGVLKNIISLSEARSASSGGVDFAFANLWRNSTVTGSNVNFGRTGNRGFGFVATNRINGGPIGRQLDLPWLTTVTKYNTQFVIITPELVASMDIDNFFETATGNWETFNLLDQLATYVPAYSSSADLRYVVQRTNAGTATGAATQQIFDGTYIAFRTGKNQLGIIKVLQAADDSDVLTGEGKIADVTTGSGAGTSDKSVNAFYSAPSLAGFDYTGVAKLYGRKCKLKIIVQK